MTDMYADTPLLRYELAQRRESGFDVDHIASAVEDLGNGPLDAARASELWTALARCERRPDWPYDEPSAFADILAVLPADDATATTVPDEDDRVHGAWIGRCAVNNLGKPVEDGTRWTRATIREYLELADAYPITDYIPALDPMPERFVLRETWAQTTRGMVNGAARDDDLDYTILGLHLVEQHGAKLDCSDVGREWLDRLPYTQTYTAERVAYRNLVNGVPATEAAEHRNPFREWIGAQIRADIFGYVHRGQPRAAALAAHADAFLSHRANGIYGEMWAAALVSAAFSSPTPREAMAESMRHIPPRSRLAEALTWVLDLHETGCTWDQAMDEVDRRFGDYHWVHTINNAVVLAVALLWGDGDFTRTAGLTVAGGLDTDSNGATAGSFAGAMCGAREIPTHWSEPLHDTVRSSIRGFDGASIRSLASRTLAVGRDDG